MTINKLGCIIVIEHKFYKRGAGMKLSGIVRLRCIWFGPGDAEVRIVSHGQEVSLGQSVAQLFFGDKPGERPGHEERERLVNLCLEGEPVQEGLVAYEG